MNTTYNTTNETQLNTPENVLKYWFDNNKLDSIHMNTLSYIKEHMPIWFNGKSKEFDDIQRQNEWLVDYLGRDVDNNYNNHVLNIDRIWIDTIEGKLSRIIVLDQFSRCIYRGDKKAFQYDSLVSSLVEDIINKDLFFNFLPIQRFFLGVAIQHSEKIEMQKIGIKISTQLTTNTASSEDIINYFNTIPGYPYEHYNVILRFNRFPSRNYALNRENTNDEIEWMNSDECPDWAKSQMKKKEPSNEEEIVNTG